MSNDKENITELDDDTLTNARIIFTTVYETIKNMDFIPDAKDKQGYLSEIQQEIDRIDVELMSRGL